MNAPIIALIILLLSLVVGVLYFTDIRPNWTWRPWWTVCHCNKDGYFMKRVRFFRCRNAMRYASTLTAGQFYFAMYNRNGVQWACKLSYDINMYTKNVE